MKRPQEEAASSRKTLPARRPRKPRKQPAQPKRILSKDSDAELIKIFGEK